MPLSTGQRIVFAAAVIALAVGSLPAPAGAAWGARDIPAQSAAVKRAVADYTAAKREADEASSRAASLAARLDELVAEQAQAQDRLEAHVASSYRLGELSYLEVIMGAADFEALSSRWFFLRQINTNDAHAVADLKAARRAAETQAADLMEQQAEASRRQRALEGTVAEAQSKLAKSKADYAAYQQSVAALNPRPRGAGFSAKQPSGASDVPQATGSGAWLTGVASHYGKGSWGRKTADGTRIGPDSMIVAHKTLPFGTLVEFEYDGKRAVARVADRGPYTAGRMWDLGPGVIRILGFNGVHEVRYRIVGK